MTHNKMSLLVMLSAVIISLSLPCITKPADAFTDQVIQQGAVGEDVIELQARLQYLGFYDGDIDGAFGWGTYWALRDFQDEFGMEMDGLAGSHAKEKLTNASDYNKNFIHGQLNKGNDFTYYGGKEKADQSDTSSDNDSHKKAEPNASNVPQGYSQNDIQLMANAVNGEARGESYVGQVAVAAVILNRVDSASFPNTVSGVIFEPGAFTAVADGQIWLTPDKTAKKAVLDAAKGWDPSGKATYYFNPKTATSDWIWSRPQIKQIGKHIFAK